MRCTLVPLLLPCWARPLVQKTISPEPSMALVRFCTVHHLWWTVHHLWPGTHPEESFQQTLSSRPSLEHVGCSSVLEWPSSGSARGTRAPLEACALRFTEGAAAQTPPAPPPSRTCKCTRLKLRPDPGRAWTSKHCLTSTCPRISTRTACAPWGSTPGGARAPLTVS